MNTLRRSMDGNYSPASREIWRPFPQEREFEMKAYICILITALALSACANPRSTTNQLELGMSKEQVRTIMGEPDSSAAIKGQGDCYYYSMWRDFWNRRPGDYSDRYYACFKSGKLVMYGRVGDPM
ncbi:MAG TPA: outer membrane protein assembly factor BamE [Ginsengibacter sp.]|nr:outer membrane protein assembly factor BamE [Ginsengibacter sp.]